MGLAKSYSAQLIGLQPEIVSIEIDITNGLHAFSVIGLGDRSVEEAKDRVSAAIKNSGYLSPKQRNQKVVVSLAPADIRKEGPSFDLSIAVAYLAASSQIDFDPERKIFFGELSLEGNVRKIHGLLPILCQMAKIGFTEAYIPQENSAEASLARGITIYPVSSLKELLDHLCEVKLIQKLDLLSAVKDQGVKCVDMLSIRGNSTAKRGLEIAAAGAHNVLIFGPPGTGKTMLAQSLPSILPDLDYDQAVEVTGIHSAAKALDNSLILHPPFRSPHHTASYPSIVGGGTFPKPGEITLAHRGVLFLDEFPEFDRSVIEALRQPLEDRTITISRTKGVITFPAQCILVASMNPCPCGKGKEKGCTCHPHLIESYKKRISGPILDRIDIWLEVSKVNYEELSAKISLAEKSEDIKERVVSARNMQKRRFLKHGITKIFNSEMNSEDLDKCVSMSDEARQILMKSAQRFQLSGRGFHRVIKVAQTIADLSANNSDCSEVNKEHVLEALQYRQKMI